VLLFMFDFDWPASHTLRFSVRLVVVAMCLRLGFPVETFTAAIARPRIYVLRRNKLATGDEELRRELLVKFDGLLHDESKKFVTT
jgi:hypothetical protein